MEMWKFDPKHPEIRYCPNCQYVVHACFAGGNGWMCSECARRIPGKRELALWKAQRNHPVSPVVEALAERLQAYCLNCGCEIADGEHVMCGDCEAKLAKLSEAEDRSFEERMLAEWDTVRRESGYRPGQE